MIKVVHKILPLFTLLLIIVFSSAVMAQKKSVSLEEASEMIRHSTQGKVLSAKTNDNNGAQSHRIRVLTPSGRVKVYNVPADNTTYPDRNLRRPLSSQPNTQQGYEYNSNRNLRPQRQYNNDAYRQSRQLENRQREGTRRNNNFNNRSRNYNRPNNTRQPNSSQPIRRDNSGQRSNNRNNRNQSNSNNNRQQSRSSRGNSQRQ